MVIIFTSFLVSLTAAWPSQSNQPLCTAQVDAPTSLATKNKLSPESIHITADNAELHTDGRFLLKGNANIMHNNRQINANNIQFNQIDNKIYLQDNVSYLDDLIYISADMANIQADKRIGQLKDARYIIKESHIFGESSAIFMKKDMETYLENASYSTCSTKKKIWNISADKIRLYHDQGIGNARNVVLKIKDIPVLYSPFLSFPINKNRKTGFLAPRFGNSERNGFTLQTPFYWNIAPSMDATIAPRIFSDNGLMLLGQLRNISSNSSNKIDLEYLFNDRKDGSDDRYFLSLNHQNKFAEHGSLSVNYNKTSDNQYFEDFGMSLETTGIQFLEQRLDILYSKDWWNISGELQKYQSVEPDTANINNYKRLPRVVFNAYPISGANQLNYSLYSEFNHFDHSSNDNINGTRLNIEPSISYPYRNTFTSLTPKLELHYTQYKIDSTTTQNSDPNLFLPLISLDGRFFFERDISIQGRSFLQTLEPRFFYLYVPEKKQDNLPVFDTNIYDFSFASLFRENRFNGGDRIGDTNQLTLALTSRFIKHNSGRELAHLNLGQIYYLADRKIRLPNMHTNNEHTSPFIAELKTRLSDHWRFASILQWNINDSNTEKSLINIQYSPSINKVFDAGYRVRKIIGDQNINAADIEQGYFSFLWPLNRNLKIAGNWQYAIPQSRSLEIFGGVKYSSCCWSIQAAIRKFMTGTRGVSDTSILISLELKGLSNIGNSNIDSFRTRSPLY